MDQRALPSIKNSKIFKITSALFRLQNNELFMHRLTGQNKFTDGFWKKIPKFSIFPKNEDFLPERFQKFDPYPKFELMTIKLFWALGFRYF